MKRAIYFVIAVTLILTSCKKKKQTEEDGIVNINMSAYFDSEAFAVGNVYTNVDGYRVRVDDFKFYISELAAIRNDGVLIPLIDIDLINLGSGYSTSSFELAPGNYRGIQFSIGVPPELNKDQDPTVYPNDHPLSVNGAQGMFWSWNTGYIFVKFEGKADLDGVEGNEILSPFAFHCGEDLLFRTHVIDNYAFTVSEEIATPIDIRFNVEKFFYSDNDTIDIAVNNLTHTSGNLPLAERFTDLFNLAIELE